MAQQSMLPVNDEELVKTIITDLFDGYRAGDTLRVKNCFTSNATLQSAYFNKEGQSTLSEPKNVSSFITYIGGGLTKKHDERIWDLTINVDNILASAWTHYAFYLDGKFSHCGSENFLLIKKNAMWKIFHLVDTREQVDCKIPETIKNR